MGRKERYLVGLDVGTSKVTAVVGEVLDSGIDVVGLGVAESRGIRRGVVVNLSSGEFSLLRAFVEHPQRVLTRDQLLDYARGRDSDAYDRAIDVQISRLRRKLDDNADGELIRTIRSEGYMFAPKVTRT